MFAANFNRIEHMEALLARGANADIANEVNNIAVVLCCSMDTLLNGHFPSIFQDEDTDLDVAHYALLRDIIRPFGTFRVDNVFVQPDFLVICYIQPPLRRAERT